MPDNMIFEEILVDRLASSTEVGTEAKENPRFRLSFMVFNEYGVQLENEINNGHTIENLFEEQSKTRKMYANVVQGQEYAMFAAGSIAGQTLDKFLVKRVKMQQVGFGQQPQNESVLSKWFGGGQNKPKADGGF